jgi:hypothetical protein
VKGRTVLETACAQAARRNGAAVADVVSVVDELRAKFGCSDTEIVAALATLDMMPNERARIVLSKAL